MNLPGDAGSGIPDADTDGAQNSPHSSAEAADEPGAAAPQRPDMRRLAEIFGDTPFPDLTSDELDDPAERRAGEHTAWLNENRPPHHDR